MCIYKISWTIASQLARSPILVIASRLVSIAIPVLSALCFLPNPFLQLTEAAFRVSQLSSFTVSKTKPISEFREFHNAQTT